jgi:ribosomal protein S18 acetylase RimI-like enzyme
MSHRFDWRHVLQEPGEGESAGEHASKVLGPPGPAWRRETAGLALVAERQGQVVGIIAVAAIPYLEREGRRGRIVALVVSSACRGQGIGRRLVDAVEEAASELDCVTMEVTSSRSRAESHPFYRNLGYEDGGDRSARYISLPQRAVRARLGQYHRTGDRPALEEQVSRLLFKEQGRAVSVARPSPRTPSVAVRAKPTVPRTAPRPRFPSAMRPWTPRHNALQRYTVTHTGTEEKRPASARIRS